MERHQLIRRLLTAALIVRTVCSVPLVSVDAAGVVSRSQWKGPLVNFTEKIVHLDLKGAPLSIAYMERIFPLLRKLGATGLLVEYEDMFPYSGALSNLSALNHYSREDIARLLKAAKKNSLSVMPLVQTFGHLEFSLKLEEHIGLREDPSNPQALCPSLDSSTAMVREMLRQVTDLHRDQISHLHIGSDEVFVIGKCSRCKKRMAAHNWTTDELFLDHARTVTAAVKEFGLRPVMWDDMFRKIPLETLLEYGDLTSSVEIMVWNYGNAVSKSILEAMEKYSTVKFPRVWVASAFKGGVSPTNQMPAYGLHLSNHVAWSVTARIFQHRLNLAGIAITGWQRFDHFTPLCELFPVSIPLLAACLAFLNTGSLGSQVLANVQKELRCNHPIPLTDPNPPLLRCSFPGSSVLVAVQQYDLLQKRRAIMESGNYFKTSMTRMNLRHGFAAPSNVNQTLAKLPSIFNIAVQVQKNMRDLTNVTDTATLKEWMETYLEPEIDWLNRVSSDAKSLLNRTVWPRRPLYAEH